jgi:hypothetical protein
MQSTINIYEVRPRKDHRGFDLVSDVLPFGRLWYDGPNAISNAIGYAEHRSRSHDSVIRVYDDRHARAQGRFQKVVITPLKYKINHHTSQAVGAD